MIFLVAAMDMLIIPHSVVFVICVAVVVVLDIVEVFSVVVVVLGVVGVVVVLVVYVSLGGLQYGMYVCVFVCINVVP